VTIVRVEKLPVVARSAGIAGTSTTLSGAAAKLHFRPLLPDLGPPDRVYVDLSSQAVLLLYGSPLRLRLEETRLGVFTKIVSIHQGIQRVSVDGSPGVWLPDAHVFDDFFGQPRLSGRALLWERGGVTPRLEGRLTKAQAFGIARSVGTG
jgi:hypothetical protein